MKLNKILPFKSPPYKKPMELGKYIKEYKIPIRGVIHVGAHYGQEVKEYHACSIKNIVLIEPMDKAFRKLQERFRGVRGIILYNCGCGSKDHMSLLNTETRNGGQSSSVLKPKEHLKFFPNIKFNGSEVVQIQTLDRLVSFMGTTRHKFNLLNVDVQGYELEVLKGATNTLKQMDILILEVNKVAMYSGCAMVEDIDFYLKDFTRVHTNWIKDCYGEAVYIKNKYL